MHRERWTATRLVTILAALAAATATAADVGPGFTYQGKVAFEGGPPFWSEVDVRFRLLDGDTLVQVPGSVQSVALDVPLNDGVFTTTVNAAGEFGPNAFDGSSRKLEVELFFDPNIVVTFPPQDILATPYAQFAPGGGGSWQPAGSDLYYDQGNVGIGNPAPAALLQVGQGDESSLLVGAEPHVELRRDLAASRFKLQIGGNNWGNARLLQIGRNDGGMPTTFTGAVGLGTDDPFTSLHLREKDLNADTLDPGVSTNTDLLIESEIAAITLVGDPAGSSDAFIDLASTDLSGTAATRVDSIWRLLKRSQNAVSGRGDLQLTNRVYNPGGNNFVPGVEHTFTDNGRFGIGTLGPLNTTVHIVQPDNAPTTMRLEGGYDGADPSIIFQDDGGTTASVRLNEGNAEALELRTDDTTRMTITQAGDVGIGTGAPADKLEIAGGDLRLSNHNGERTVELISDTGSSAPSGSELRMYKTGGASAGDWSILLDTSYFGGTPAMVMQNNTSNITLEMYGDYEGSGNSRIITDVLQINGADLSEQFDVTGAETVEAGLVVSIDPENPGKLIVADEPYDRKVAGIISGAGGVRTGLLMGQEGTLASGRHAVALTGRVWCHVDASFGAVGPGDLLTTSATPGHAMKADDDTRSRGAVIGKAMTALERGTGMVLVLVQPQ